MQAKILINRTDFIHILIGNFDIRDADYDNVEIISTTDKTLIIKGDQITRTRIDTSGSIYDGSIKFKELKDKVHPKYLNSKMREVFNWRKFKFQEILTDYLFFFKSNVIIDYYYVVEPESKWLKGTMLQYSNIPYKLEILK